MLLVTGATGHLGANLVRRLLADGHGVRVLLRNSSDNTALEGLDVEPAYGDVRDLASLTSAARGCRQVYHCAAKVSITSSDKQEIFETNVLGTRNVLMAARESGVERVVVSGSLSAVGYEPGRPANENIPFNPFEKHLPYELSKAAAEHECLKAVAEGLDVVIAISCAILGPFDFKPSRMGRVLIDFANGKLRAYVPGGFEFVAARDIVEGHVLAMQKGRPGERYIFSTEFLTIDELMSIYEEVTGRPRPRLCLPAPVMAVAAGFSSFVLSNFFPNAPQRFTPGSVRLLRSRRRADCSKARRELGYQPTTIRQAVVEAYNWFVERAVIRSPKRALSRAAEIGVRP